jgi:DHA1 family tetracycline resistance protein-like MFS transporter
MRNTLLSRLLWVILIDQTYITITFPLLAIIFFDTHSRLFTADTPDTVRSVWYGLCVALPNIMNMFFAPILSTLSDELGRKKILLVEIFSASLFTLLVGLGVFSGQLVLVILGLAIKGAFARTNPTALAMVGDISSKREKVLNMGYLQFAISIGAALGPILGGYIASRYFFAQLNFSLPFFLAAMLASMNGVLASVIICETYKKNTYLPTKRLDGQPVKSVVTYSAVWQVSLILCFIQFSWSIYYQFIPPILKMLYHFNSQQLGWFMGMIACWLAVTTGIGIKVLSGYLTLRQLLLMSMYLVLVGLLLTLSAGYHLLPDAMLWLGAMPTAAGDVIAYSCLTALYSNMTSRDKQGRIMGISFIVVALTWAMTGFLGGLILSFQPMAPILLAPMGIIFALIVMHTRHTRLGLE